ncbi:LysM peptidoglycan-binding domain-containing protein [Paenibacillus beijingensis]|uniref:LysM peptidoglycan-binding domain-containing protein n=1 Tax=Paenibacillus beijingensis TaxID=1126833 RepID=UPI0006980B55|nr:LysM peptidoglycan-binding domain-containing protein [Paenibacillus beijingensis]
MTDQSNGLRFDVYERVHLPDEVPAIEELEEIELVPRIQVVQQGNQALLKGQLLLRGVYRTLESETSPQTMEHRIPVEITLPMNRIERLDDISVEIDNFDVDLLSVRTLNITGVLSLLGIKMEGAPEPDPSWQEEPFTVVHRRDPDFLPDNAGAGAASVFPNPAADDAAWGAARRAAAEPGADYEGAQPYKAYAAPPQTAGLHSAPQPSFRQPAAPDPEAYWPVERPAAELARPQADRPPHQTAAADAYAQPSFPAWTQQLQQAIRPQPPHEPVTEPFAGEAESHSDISAGYTSYPEKDREPEPQGWELLSGGADAQLYNEPEEEDQYQDVPDRAEAEAYFHSVAGAYAEQTEGADQRPDEDEAEEEPVYFSPFFTEPEASFAAAPPDNEKQEMRVAVGSKKPHQPQEPARREQSGFGFKSLLASSRREQEARQAAEQYASRLALEEETSGGEDIEWKSLFLGRFGEEDEFRKVRLCIVQREETLDQIAERYQLNPREIALYNRLSNQSVAQGQVLYIP